jgi:alpha-tubulin suppressor-like RCC1 family protein
MSTVYVCGQEARRYIDGTTVDQYGLAATPIVGDFVSMSGGILLSADGRLYMIGYDHGYLPVAGSEAGRYIVTPELLPDPTDGATWVKYSSTGDGTVMAIDSLGRLWLMGAIHYILGTSGNFVLFNDVETWVDCSYYDSTYIALTSSGNLWTGGWNNNGQCAYSDIGAPAPWAARLSDVEIAKTGGQVTIAKKTSGSLWSCGWNFYGQLGLIGSYIIRKTVFTSVPNPLGTDAAYLMPADTITLISSLSETKYAKVSGSAANLGFQDVTDGVDALNFSASAFDEPITQFAGSSATFVVMAAGSRFYAKGSNANGRAGLGVEIASTLGAYESVTTPAPIISASLVGGAMFMLLDIDAAAPTVPFWTDFTKTKERLFT